MFGYVQTNKLTEYVSSRVPTIITEREFDVVGYDKVFAATWVNSEEVLMGTKCNKVIMHTCMLCDAHVICAVTCN